MFLHYLHLLSYTLISILLLTFKSFIANNSKTLTPIQKTTFLHLIFYQVMVIIFLSSITTTLFLDFTINKLDHLLFTYIIISLIQVRLLNKILANLIASLIAIIYSLNLYLTFFPFSLIVCTPYSTLTFKLIIRSYSSSLLKPN